MKQLALVAAAAIAGVLLAKHSRESTPPPADPTPRREVIQPQAEDAPSTATPALEEPPSWRYFYCPDCHEWIERPKASTPPEEPSVWYSSYDAAGKVALETGRPLIVAITEEKPEFEPTSDVAFCWLHLAEVGPEWDRFNPPCVLRCDRVTDSEPPKFTPITLEDL